MPIPANRPIVGAGYLLRGLGLITRPGLRRFVILPLLVNLTVFSLGLYWAFSQLGTLSAWIETQTPDWLHWLQWLVIPAFFLFAAVILFFGFGLIANLIAAPFNGLLAEQVERRLSGRTSESETRWGQLARDAIPSIFDELKKMLYALAWLIPILLLGLIPFIGPVLAFLLTAWILALQYVDFPMGNNGLRFRDQRRTLGRERLMALGFGSATAAMTAIPIVNFLVMPAAVCGATALWLEQLSPDARS